ncbi:pre-mRNA-splicing factor [Acrasis kona]|uniref:Pre-mRNA-splicing factor n=1 Tax=Acrasis kona TaxID=1008807 RepID=A0AAW2ZRQ4_9EUKA
MYNGIGLNTARGSGTNGYVSRNMAYINPNKTTGQRSSSGLFPDVNKAKLKKANPHILEHERNRKIEAAVFELKFEMEETGKYTAEDIEKALQKCREEKTAELNFQKNESESFRDKRRLATGDAYVDSHEAREAQLRKNDNMKRALYIGRGREDANEEEAEMLAFNPELRKKKRMEQLEAKERLEKLASKKHVDTDGSTAKRKSKDHGKRTRSKSKRYSSDESSSSSDDDSDQSPRHKRIKRGGSHNDDQDDDSSRKRTNSDDETSTTTGMVGRSVEQPIPPPKTGRDESRQESSDPVKLYRDKLREQLKMKEESTLKEAPIQKEAPRLKSRVMPRQLNVAKVESQHPHAWTATKNTCSPKKRIKTPTSIHDRNSSDEEDDRKARLRKHRRALSSSSSSGSDSSDSSDSDSYKNNKKIQK